jgi:hypothetical protein
VDQMAVRRLRGRKRHGSEAFRLAHLPDTDSRMAEPVGNGDVKPALRSMCEKLTIIDMRQL